MVSLIKHKKEKITISAIARGVRGTCSPEIHWNYNDLAAIWTKYLCYFLLFNTHTVMVGLHFNSICLIFIPYSIIILFLPYSTVILSPYSIVILSPYSIIILFLPCSIIILFFPYSIVILFSSRIVSLSFSSRIVSLYFSSRIVSLYFFIPYMNHYPLERRLARYCNYMYIKWTFKAKQ